LVFSSMLKGIISFPKKSIMKLSIQNQIVLLIPFNMIDKIRFYFNITFVTLFFVGTFGFTSAQSLNQPQMAENITHQKKNKIQSQLETRLFVENKGQFDAPGETNSYYARFILALPITPKIKFGLQSENYFDFFENTDPQKREVESMFMNPSDSKQIIIINGIQAYLKVQL